jgi:hypothetical protein
MNKINIYGELASGIKGGYVTSTDQIRGLSEFIRSYKNVEFFDGFVNALDEYSEESTALPVRYVVFLADKGIFGRKSKIDGLYHSNWNDIRYPAADFNSYEDGISPRADRIFEDITTGKRYVWNNSSLEEYTES